MLSRRNVLKGAGGLVATAFPATAAARPQGQAPSGATRGGDSRASADVTGRLARYMVEARDRQLPATVIRDAKHRILDTIGAMVSGAALKPGVLAIRYVQAQGGTAESS
ncbi:MAG TPA: hypothetical protein VFS23_20965, partial [Vicinamibacterales bacterium]|nr:hypothetical protein [Vicinamibacterales bacterium]